MLLAMPPTSQTLPEMYDAMLSAFGHRAWWPSRAGAGTPEGKLEICIGAVLTQNTNWTNVEKAIGNLQAAGKMSVSALRETTPEALAGLIRPAGYFNVKARRLLNLIARVHAEWDEDIAGFLDRPAATLREELLSIKGIGRETADSIILYAAGRPIFVVDAYTCRVLARHRLISPEDDYEAIRDLIQSALPEDVELWRDFHAQFVEVGKRHCRPRARCAGCPLEAFPHDIDPEP